MWATIRYSDIPVTFVGPLAVNAIYMNTRNFHPKKYRPLTCNTNYYMGTFFPSTVNIWNTLPAATLDQPNIAKFKDELDRFYWLYSKMSLTVFIDFIYIYIVNRFNSISVFNSHSLGMQCMYVFFFFFFFLLMVWNYYFISARWLPPLRINKVKVKALKGKSILLTVL